MTTCLNTKGVSISDGIIRLLFIVNCHGKINYAQKISGSNADAATLSADVLKFSGIWLPGRQNNYIESAYMGLDLAFKNNMLIDITIAQ